MMYIVHYIDDDHVRHMTFVKTFKEVNFIRERFGNVTVESYRMNKESARQKCCINFNQLSVVITPLDNAYYDNS